MRVFHSILAALMLAFAPQALWAGETKMLFPDGKYEGEVANGIRHGRGVFTWHSDGGSFDGSWANGKMEGRGVYTSKTGKSTNLFYRQGELAVDYQALPENHISIVCQLASELFVGQVEDYVQVSSVLTTDGASHVVDVTFRFKEKGVSTEGSSVCKFAKNEEHQIFEMTEARIGDIAFVGDEAKETGQLMEQILFIPSNLQ